MHSCSRFTPSHCLCISTQWTFPVLEIQECTEVHRFSMFLWACVAIQVAHCICGKGGDRWRVCAFVCAPVSALPLNGHHSLEGELSHIIDNTSQKHTQTNKQTVETEKWSWLQSGHTCLVSTLFSPQSSSHRNTPVIVKFLTGTAVGRLLAPHLVQWGFPSHYLWNWTSFHL